AVMEDDRENAVALGRKLADKAEAHFAHEERLMTEVAYVNAERHRQIHADFLAETGRQLADAESRGLSVEVLRWVSELDQWFYRHVMTEDMWLAFAVKRVREPHAAAGR
ncbi:MAG TPA: hemerythrin family protein, partial [Myxococcales bacterium]|nr:hemerythrin family protein [Myxococcales bacterium]